MIYFQNVTNGTRDSTFKHAPVCAPGLHMCIHVHVYEAKFLELGCFFCCCFFRVPPPKSIWPTPIFRQKPSYPRPPTPGPSTPPVLPHTCGTKRTHLSFLPQGRWAFCTNCNISQNTNSIHRYYLLHTDAYLVRDTQTHHVGPSLCRRMPRTPTL